MPKIVQMEFDFTPNKPAKKEFRPGRPNHRTTMLTTDSDTYKRVRDMDVTEEIEVEFTNDIISSAKGGASKIHHAIRRCQLLRRQIEGGWRRVKVRCRQGEEVIRYITSKIIGAEDACSARVWISASPIMQ